MADHGSTGTHSHGFEEHAATYQGFLKGAVVLTMVSLYVLVALVAFAFISSSNLLVGFGGLIVGILALLIDLRAGNNWYVSVGWLVLYGLITAVLVG